MDPIRLEIYLDDNQKASGLLYLDDGKSFNYQTSNEKILIKYWYENATLSYDLVFPPENFFEAASLIKITEIVIYGLKAQPKSAFDLYHSLFQPEPTPTNIPF